jgi:hypothetical protein
VLLSAENQLSHAAVARRKRKVLRKIRTEGNCGPRKELAAADRRITHSTKVAQGRGHDRKDNVAQETRKGRTFGKFVVEEELEVGL